VGNNNRLKYTLNGKKLILPGNGVKVFKIGLNAPESWTMQKWQSIFADRL
jgi:hypothetical protein